jgi:thermitase
MTRFGLVGRSLALGAFALATVASANVKHVPGELIVKLKQGSQKSLQALGVQVDRQINLSYDTLYVVKTSEKSLKSLQASLESNPDVEYVEPNFIYEIVKPVESYTINDFLAPLNDRSELNYTPSDARFGELWGLKNTGSNDRGGSRSEAGADIDAIAAWGITRGSKNVKIAVIDTGIDYNHPDLVDNIWTNEAEANGAEGVDDDGNGYVDDIHGYDFANNDGDPIDGHSHGTHCAGTIAGVHNDIGVAGVMADATLVAVKFLSDAGSGSTEGAIKAVDYATKVGVDLMSNSWGGGGHSQALMDAIARARDAGIIFTAAAGNSSSNNDSRPHYPSNYQLSNVVSVAAHTAQNTLASFSCYGRTTVHIAAPGHNILSTTKNGGYDSYSGTSMATPHVSGALGLLLAQEGRMDHEEMRERLMATSVPHAAYRGKTIRGGRLQAYNLLTDTRPPRNEPKPGAWETVDLDEAWESAHPYMNDANVSKTYTFEGAKFVRLKVRKYDLESGYDYLQVSDGSRNTVEKVSGAGENYASDYVEGDTLIVTFKSDRSVTKWGFVVDAVDVQY